VKAVIAELEKLATELRTLVGEFESQT